MADDKPVTLYTASTPNGWKASVTLEELGVQYNVRKITLGKNEQKEDWFLKINPNGRIPALVDHSNDDFEVFESGAIMLYLCDRFDPEGKLLPKDLKERHQVISWLMFQMGGLGPMQGQAHHFVRYAPVSVEYGKNRYVNETKRLYGVLESQLEKGPWLAAGKYTIADIANYSWVVIHFWAGVTLEEFPKLKDWVDRISERKAVNTGMDVPEPSRLKEVMKDPAKLQKSIEEAQNMMVSTKPT
ncbi:hypothetical protein BSKO_11581 [Bryopsis sp. KO-2023]|nr:hypothetical protein BSKO_11581 [Bryopsis sp. KO-2023]